MPEPGPRDLEAGLAQIDQRLREIQDELLGEAPLGTSEATEPAPTARGREGPLASVLGAARNRPDDRAADRSAEEEAPAAEHIQALEQQIEALTTLRARLLTSIRDLVDGYEAAIGASPVPGPPEVRVSAGPFASTEDVREFERELDRLPGVLRVSRRGYEGEDRAVLDVTLKAPGEPTS
jgi:hypothetical protein